MIEWIVTSCVLIAAVLGIRLLLKNRISGRLRYGLWLLVLIRLLIPFSLPSGISVMNLLPEETQEQLTVGYVGYELPDLAVAEPNPDLAEDVWDAMHPQNRTLLSSINLLKTFTEPALWSSFRLISISQLHTLLRFHL